MPSKLFAFKFGFNARKNKIVIAAAITGAALEFPEWDGSKGDDRDWQNNAHPLGRTPVLESESGYLFESNAILRHIARTDSTNSGLYGRTLYEASLVDSWLDFTTTEVDTITGKFLYKKVFNGDVDEAKETTCLIPVLERLDAWLEIRTFLVGERLTIADIAMFVSLDLAFRFASTATQFYKYKNVVRFYNTVINQPKVGDALRSVEHPGTVAEKPKEEKAAAAPAKKEEKPKKDEKPAQAGLSFGDDEEDAPQEKKKPNPLDLLPPSKFVLDAFKREYSNNDTRKVAAPYLFDNFDNEGFTAFWCNYKYNDENKMQFMTANLVRGWFQRMDHMRKYAFGCALIIGEDKKHEITAFWIFRGKGLPEMLQEVDDTELFTWTEIPDIKAEAAKITDFLAWDGESFATKPMLEGRCFK